VLAVEFHGLLALHLAAGLVVPQGLGLHDLLHLRTPALLPRDEHAGGVADPVGHLHLLHLVPQHLLNQLAEAFLRGLLLFEGFLLLFGLLQVQVLLGAALQFLAFELLDLLDGVLVDGVAHDQHFLALLLELLEEGAVEQTGFALAGDLVDVFLVLLHTGHLFLEGNHLVLTLVGLVAQETHQFVSVLGILVHT